MMTTAGVSDTAKKKNTAHRNRRKAIQQQQQQQWTEKKYPPEQQQTEYEKKTRTLLIFLHAYMAPNVCVVCGLWFSATSKLSYAHYI